MMQKNAESKKKILFKIIFKKIQLHMYNFMKQFICWFAVQLISKDPPRVFTSQLNPWINNKNRSMLENKSNKHFTI